MVTFSPHDKKLQKDIKDLEKEIDRRANTKARTPNPTKRPLPILTSEQSPTKDEALMKPLKTTIYKNNNTSRDATSNRQETSEETLPRNVSEAPIASGARDSPRAEATARNNTPTTPPTALCERAASAKKAVTVVPQKPKTTLEFERTCGMLKENPKLAREYVKTIEVKKYPELFKESFTANILRCFVYVLRKGFMPKDAMVNQSINLPLPKVLSMHDNGRLHLFVNIFIAFHQEVLIVFDVVITLPCSTLIFNFLTISVRRYAIILLVPLLFFFFHILIDIKFKHVTSTYHHS